MNLTKMLSKLPEEIQNYKEAYKEFLLEEDFD